MKPNVPEGPPIRNAGEFFDMCERTTRRVFDPNDIDRPVLVFVDTEGRVRFRPVSGEDEAAELTQAAWDYPIIAAIGFLRERDGAIVATYRTRTGEESESRTPIFGSGNTRTLGTPARKIIESPKGRVHGRR